MTNEKQVKASGYTAKREHWHNVRKHGVKTSCKIKLSYASNDNKEFYYILKNYPEMCCLKCAANFREYVKMQLALKEKSNQ